MNTKSQTVIEAGTLAAIAYADCKPNPWNRKRFDPEKLKELAASIKSLGILEPIIVRKSAKAYEIVAGERRWRAAKGILESVPAKIVDITDVQLVEIMAVENSQREDVHPLEEARQYEYLIKNGHDADSLAVKVGKSKAYIYARLKLTALSEACHSPFLDGRISASAALLIARIPNDKLQATACAEILKGSPFGAHRNEPMSYREAEEHIHNRYMLDLRKAPFPTNDTKLVPEAGPCKTCPKRTGNQVEIFGDVKSADVCTDPPCFQSKVRAFSVIQVTKAREEGRKVIDAKDAEGMFDTYQKDRLNYQAPVASLDDSCNLDPKRQTYRKLLGKQATQLTQIVVNPHDGKAIEVVDKNAANKALRERYEWAKPQPAESNRYKQEQQSRERKAAAAKIAFAQAVERIVEKAEATQFDDKRAHAIVSALITSSNPDPIVARRGLAPPDDARTAANFKGDEDLLLKAAAKMTAPQLRGLMVELLISEFEPTSWAPEFTDDFKAIAKAFAVDLGKLSDRATAEQKEIAKEKAAAKRAAEKKKADKLARKTKEAGEAKAKEIAIAKKNGKKPSPPPKDDEPAATPTVVEKKKPTSAAQQTSIV